MIQKQVTKKGSIKKAQEKVERQEVQSPIKESMPLIGRVGAFHCDTCDDVTVHRITNQNIQCIECRQVIELKENPLIGDNKSNQLQEVMIF